MASEPPPLPITQPLIYLDSGTLHTLLSPHLLIPHLLTSLPAFSLSIRSPPCLSYTLPFLSSSPASSPSSLSSLSSSASSSPNSLHVRIFWSTNPSLPYFSVKNSSFFPSNSSLLPPRPCNHATVSLFHSLTGAHLASLDGTALCLLRIAAVSGLASSLLSLPSSQTLLIIGSHLITCHISAHRTARPSINRIFIWNSNPKDVLGLIHELHMREPDYSTVTFHYSPILDEVIGLADIVCCTATCRRPLVKGRLLKPGAHLDLVGTLTSEMKECDDEALLRGRVFVDIEVAKDGAGEFVDFAGTLIELAGGKKEGRKTDDEVTVFKSVGSAPVDLLAAQLAYESYIKTVKSHRIPYFDFV